MVRENRQFVTEFAEPYHHVTRSLHLDEILPNMLFEPRRIAYLRVFCDYVIHVLIFAHRAVEEFLHKRREQRVLLLRPVHLRAFYFQLVFFAQSDTRILDTGDEHLREVENYVLYRASFFHSRNILTFLRILECSDLPSFCVCRTDLLFLYLAIFVHFIYVGFPDPYLDVCDLFRRELFQVLHQRPQRITVGHDDNVLTLPQIFKNVRTIRRRDPRMSLFETFPAGYGM